MNEWIDWNGGPCPVDDDDLVDIFWDEEWGFDAIPAERIDWHDEAPFRYRLSAC